MSLPQRKKSAEEIAKLRESLGIPGQPPTEETSPAESPPTEAAAEVKAVETVEAEAEPEPAAKAEPDKKPAPAAKKETIPAEPASAPVEKLLAEPILDPLPIAEAPAPRVVRSLRRSERIPVLPVEDEDADTSTAIAREDGKLPGKTVLPALQVARPVRSLRKSEQAPITELPEPPPDSKLPVHRHSGQELGEIRRREAIAALSPQAPPKPMVAHLAVVIPGYLAAIAGGLCFKYYELSIQVTATCVGIALLLAAFIFIKRPLSRHHAAFIAVMTLFVIVFGALYYFPQLQHGT